jgi:putative ABC transport system permease protein
MSRFESARARVRLLFRRNAESRMETEMRFHLDMEQERLMRDEHLDAAEALRRARLAFGGEERYREEMRDGRGFGWLSGMRLDLKLGLRMLARYPGLTAASTLAIMIAVALAVSFFEFVGVMARPQIRVPNGDRIVVLQNYDRGTAQNDGRTLHELEQWRAELSGVQHVAGAASTDITVTTEDGRVVSMRGARVTASLFEVAGVAPMLGRPLSQADEALGTPLAIVLSHRAWQRLFDGDRAALGSNVRIGADVATVVGVMPEGFAFPINEEWWAPLREQALAYERRTGPSLMVVGLLAPGTTIEKAQAEISAMGARNAAQFPRTHEHLEARVQPMARAIAMPQFVNLLNLPFLLFLFVVCGNVATLVFARTATRESELAVRSALGASRRRLVIQLFAEALVLTFVGTAFGLMFANWGYGRAMALFWEVQESVPPFWFTPALSGTTILYTFVLAMIAAAIIGGVPALKATGRRLRHHIAQPGSGGAGMRFGAVSTAVVVVQVAICVAFLPYAMMQAGAVLPEEQAADNFPAEEYLSARIVEQTQLSGSGGTDAARSAADNRFALMQEVQRRIAALDGVVAVTFATRIPGLNHPFEGIVLEGDSTLLDEVRVLGVDPNFFAVMGGRIVAGRNFRVEDAASAVPVVVVDDVWARENLQGANAIGRRIRLPNRGDGEGEAWQEIVGVVAGLDPSIGPMQPTRVFQPLRMGLNTTTQIFARTAGAPEVMAPLVSETVSAIAPAFGVVDLKPLDEVWSPVLRSNRYLVSGMATMGAVLMLFALIGIFALMSFTVSQRAREIGIRTALGANPRRIVLSIFARAIAQISLGVLVGAALISLAVFKEPGGPGSVAIVALLMTVFGMLGCVLPARRALRIQPTAALRTE